MNACVGHSRLLLCFLLASITVIAGCEKTGPSVPPKPTVTPTPVETTEPAQEPMETAALPETLPEGWGVLGMAEVEAVPVPADLEGQASAAYRVTFQPAEEGGASPALRKVVSKAVAAGDSMEASLYLWSDEEVTLNDELAFQLGRHGATEPEFTNVRPATLNSSPTLFTARITFEYAHEAIREMVIYTGSEPLTCYVAYPAN